MRHNVTHISTQSVIIIDIIDIIRYFFSYLVSIVEAKLSCEFKTEKDQNPRIEWKKMEEKGTSFVYFNGSFAGEWPSYI